MQFDCHHELQRGICSSTCNIRSKKCLASLVMTLKHKETDTHAPEPSARPHGLKPCETILFGGLIAGVLDGLDAVIFYGCRLVLHRPGSFKTLPPDCWGARSFHGGWYTAFWASHVISRSPSEPPRFFIRPVSHPSALAEALDFRADFGVLVYLFMHYVVIPLSALPKRTVPVTFLKSWTSCFRTPCLSVFLSL